MKKIFSLLIILLAITNISAVLEVKIQNSDNTLIAGVDKPATFDMKIKNSGQPDNFEFYNFLGFSMFPKGTIYIGQGQTKDVKIEIYPIGELKQRGKFTFQYFIKGQNTTETKEELTVNIIELKDAFEIGSGEMDPDSNSLEIYIQNKESFEFKDIQTEFSSVFFNIQKNFTFLPNEKKQFTIELNREDFKKLMAGFYTLNAELIYKEQKAEVEGVIKFVEKNLVSTEKKDYGLLINTQIIEKENKGNTLAESETVIKKNIISRLFTSFTPEPDIVERQGATVFYTWSREIPPGETLEITVKTNWLFPLIVILFIVAIVILAKKYSATDLSLGKRVSFVRTKGGEFALKISISVHARKYIERVNIIDRLPLMVKLHERFGIEKPSKVNEKTRRIEWNFEKLEQGEVRVLTYIIYSKVGILGKFALPTATAIYERDGKIKETESNRTYFIAEQRTGKDDDEF